MNQLTDLALAKPLPQWCIDGLMFGAFMLHLIFVLVAIGTAILAVYFFIEIWWGGRLDEVRWDKLVLRTFLVHKSLAVVIGVAALLAIQVGYAVPFLTAINLHAPYWMLIIPFLIIAFVSFDALGHKIYVHHYLHLFFGIVALVLLLAVPGVFVAVLVTAENPAYWIDMARVGGGIPWGLTWHWLTRYTHVIGAAVVLGATFHYWFTAGDDPGKRRKLLGSLVVGILFQIAGGIMLYGSIPSGTDALTDGILLCGVLATVFLLWFVYSSQRTNTAPRGQTFAIILMAVLLPMLLARQVIQNRTFVPMSRELHQRAESYDSLLNTHKQAALSAYKKHLENPLSTGKAMYLTSCAFCHGENGNGDGKAARNLEIAPEQLTAIRASQRYLYDVLLNGVPGTSMPTFTFYDRNQLDRILGYLNEEHAVFSKPEAIPSTFSSEAREQAQAVWRGTCSACHGQDGRGSKLSAKYRPAPPNLTLYSLTPRRMFNVITDGYPRTMMVPFGQLPEPVRWALVDLVIGKFRHREGKSEK